MADDIRMALGIDLGDTKQAAESFKEIDSGLSGISDRLEQITKIDLKKSLKGNIDALQFLIEGINEAGGNSDFGRSRSRGSSRSRSGGSSRSRSKRGGSRSRRGGARGQEGETDALGNVGAIFGTLASITSGLEEVDEEGQKVTSMLIGMSGAFEDAHIGLARATDIGKEISDTGKSLNKWGLQIEDSISKIEDVREAMSDETAQRAKAAKWSKKAGSAMEFAGKHAGKFAAGLEGLALGFQIYDTLVGKSSEQIDKRLGLIKKEHDSTKSLNELIKTSTQEGTQKRIEAIKEEVASQQKLSEQIRADAVKNTDTFSQIRSIAGNVFFGDTTMYGATGDALTEINGGLDDLGRELEQLSDPTFQAAMALADLRKEIEKTADEVANELIRREEELFDARFEIMQSESDLQDKLIDEEWDFREESSKIREDRNRDDKQALREHFSELDLMETRYQSNVRATNLDHYRELSKIETDYLEGLADLIKDHEENLTEMDADFNQANIDAKEDFREEEVDSQLGYNKRLAKMEEDYNKERIKRQRDLENDLFEAEMDNDALRHFMLKRQSEIDGKEAEKQHGEELTDEQKAFKEAKGERLKEFKEQQQERREQYAEDKAEAAREHVESIAQAKEQFDEETALAKDQHKTRLEDMQFQFMEEQALAVKAFRARAKDRQVARAEEDADRLDRLALRRHELQKAFEAELEYFQLRETALMDFIRGGESLKAKEERFKGAVTSPTEISSAEANQLQQMLFTEIGRRGPQDTVKGMAESQALTDLLVEVGKLTEKGGVLDVTGLGDDKEWLEQGVNIGKLFAGAVEEGINVQMTELGTSHKFDLTYITEDEKARARTIEGIERDSIDMYTGLKADNQEHLDDMGLIQTMSGLQTIEEAKEQAALEKEVIESLGEETLEDLQATFGEMGDQIEDSYESQKTEREDADATELESLKAHHEDRAANDSQFKDDIVLATDKAHEDELAKDESFNEAKSALSGEHRDAITEQEALNHDNEMVRMDEEFARESALWEQFMADLEKGFKESARDMQRDIMRETSKGSQQIVNQHGQMINAIIQAGSQGLNSLNQFIAQSKSRMDSFSRTTSGSSSSSSSTLRSSSTGRSYNERLARLMAAKGAFIDRPTALIAGEGRTSEVVMPFDESKGIPDNILKGLAQSMASGLNDEMPARRTGGDMNTRLLAQILVSMKSRGAGSDLSIGNINVGSNISRAEIREQMGDMQQVMVNVMHETINVQ